MLTGIKPGGLPPMKARTAARANEGFVTYAGPATIKKSGDKVMMPSVIDSAVEEGAVADRRRVSWEDEWEFDCQNKRHRPCQYTWHSGIMGTGEKMFRHTVAVAEFNWIPVGPGSVGERLWKIACGKE